MSVKNHDGEDDANPDGEPLENAEEEDLEDDAFVHPEVPEPLRFLKCVAKVGAGSEDEQAIGSASPMPIEEIQIKSETPVPVPIDDSQTQSLDPSPEVADQIAADRELAIDLTESPLEIVGIASSDSSSSSSSSGSGLHKKLASAFPEEIQKQNKFEEPSDGVDEVRDRVAHQKEVLAEKMAS